MLFSRRVIFAIIRTNTDSRCPGNINILIFKIYNINFCRKFIYIPMWDEIYFQNSSGQKQGQLRIDFSRLDLFSFQSIAHRPVLPKIYIYISLYDECRNVECIQHCETLN